METIKDRLSVFINSFESDNPDYLSFVEKEALSEDVPIIRKETQSLLKFILKANSIHNILEVGTAVGFSALFMAEYSDAKITTIEKYEKRIPKALNNFEKYDKDKKITLIEGDATDILKEIDEKYDLIFMDAAKAQYINFLPDVKRLLAKGGLLISDNVLQDLDILESKFAVERRDRTIHKRMREYLFEITHCEEFTTIILPSGDGVAISLKND